MPVKTTEKPNSPYVVEAIRASVEDVYLVGGAIRDSLMGIEAKGDLDFATPLQPQEVKKRLEDSGFKVTDYSEKFGTIATTISKTKVEITTFRQEAYTPPSRKPEVSFTGSLSEDLARRDFTMNAIAHDGEEYIDPYDGQEDIINQKIRAVGDPRYRFREDPLRMLRAMRFVSTLGFTLESSTYDAIFKDSYLASSLTGERIAGELNKLLAGEHWVQAISIGAETKIFEHIFNLEVPDSYISEFIELLSAYASRYTSSGIETRWMIVILAILGSTKTQSSDSRWKLLSDIITRIKQRLAWSNRVAELIYEKVHSEMQNESILYLEDELKQLEADHDSRSYIVEERLLRIKMKVAFTERRFDHVLELADRMVAVQNKNLEIKKRISVSRTEAISDTVPRIYSTLKYICACHIYKRGFIEDSKSLNKILSTLASSKNIFGPYDLKINKPDRAQIVEDALLMLSNLMPGRITALSTAEILEAHSSITIDRSRLELIKNSYLRQLIALRRQAATQNVQAELYRLNKKIADLILEINDNEPDITYYVQLSDAYKSQALAATNKKDFWKSFENMNKAMDEVDRLTDTQESFGYQRHGQYLDSAKCLVHLMTLERKLDKKIEIADSIIVNYKMAGHNYERNVPRYRLLKDWLVLAKDILESDAKSSAKLLKNIPLLKSYDYEDVDEAYVAEHLPEIIAIRHHMKDVENYLNMIHTRSDNLPIDDSELTAAATLARSKLIDLSFALEILKRVIQTQVDKDISIEPLTVLGQGPSQAELHDAIVENENLKLIEKGESETVEFKESWKYDIKAKEVDPHKQIKMSALKAIASFMNTRGGTLLIGVNDKGVVTGLEDADFLIHKRKNYGRLQLQDELKKDIDNSFAQLFGAATSTLKEVSFDIIDGKTIAVVKVQRSNDPVFLEKQLYVRNSASSRVLDAEEVYKFFKSRA